MKKFVRVLKEGALWLAFLVVATVFCYGIAAVISAVCGVL